MKDKFRKLAALALFTVALSGAALAQGYEHEVRADIPFNFYAGGKLLHAGSYICAINLESHNIAMVPRDRSTGSFLPGVPEDGSRDGHPRLTFRTNGGHVHVLQKIQWADFGASFDVKKVLADVGEERSLKTTETVLAQLVK